MNLQQLRFIRAVAETASFSQAARLCCVTQPALSNAVAQFEQEMGGRIFVRTTRQVSITKFGEHLLGYVHAVLEAQEELVSSVNEFLEPRHKLLKIGFSPLIDMGLLNLALDAYRHHHRDVEIFFKECYLDDLEGRLDDETIDVAVLPRRKQPADRESCAFYSEPLCILDIGSHNPSKHNGVVRLKAFADLTVILTGGGCGLNAVVGDLFKRERLDMRVYPGHALSYQVLQDWALLGIGAAILPQSKLCDKAKQQSLPLVAGRNKPARVTFEMVWNADTTRPAYIDDLITHFKDVVPEMVAGVPWTA